MTPLERLVAAGIDPCAACVWRHDEVVVPCDKHRRQHAAAALEHVQKLSRIAQRRGLTVVKRIA